ncbi:hypothetical protein P12x_003179 [Tundrisphaera lichenicola]|uniref:hypothetical protein n=1 Tax=Tundrisphaera lichenicola TaxID=2029860 RepID=UPI003EBBB714
MNLEASAIGHPPTRRKSSNVTPPSNRLDPDRFFNRTSPGAHEWWYFDAISDDGRDALVIVWYAGLPFDPAFGVATLRHLRNPAKYPAPRSLDHSAIGMSWYRDGKTMAYALNGFKAGSFRHQAEPFEVEIGSSRVQRDDDGYRLSIETPSVQGKPIRAELRFRPAGATEPFERDLGTPDAPHNWILAAADCRVEGSLSIGPDALDFAGRGYHDHNAGAEDLSVAMRRWEWGRVHSGPMTQIYYWSEPHRGESRSLRIACRDGRVESVQDDLRPSGDGPERRNVFGIRHREDLRFEEDASRLTRSTRACLDDGPFYRRWLADFRVDSIENPAELCKKTVGIAELLETRNLHRSWFNWMIPYRLKRF